ncbi:MAG: ribosome biogenesis GTPase Der [Verrucomicrobiota bacterium]
MKPVVAIVGRPNVGKSALFNRLSRKQISLVYDKPGVTRDRITLDCIWKSKAFTLVDTGGVGLEDDSGFEADIEREVAIAIDLADDIFFVVDGREGVTALDKDLGRRLRRARQRIFLVVNKLDSSKQDDWEFEFLELGFEQVFPVSAAHGRGIAFLMDDVSKDWPAGNAGGSEVRNDEPLNIAVVGRPNAGKSSLINALLDEDRVIVSPLAGTTRDAVDVHFENEGQKFCLVDTAGMRKRSKLQDPLERAMTARSAHSINRADICVLVIDAELGAGVQEKKIAGLIQKAGKPCLIVVNKWDLARDAKVFDATADRGDLPSPEKFLGIYRDALYKEMFFLKYAPVVFTSALEKRRLGGWFDAVREICEARETLLPAGKLNRLIEEATKRHPPVRVRNRSLKIYYIAQKRERVTSTTLVAFINNRDLWSDEYQRFLEQAIRTEYPLKGCPLLWHLKDKSAQKSQRESKPKQSRREESRD